jgi:hypothetical protein
VYAEISRGRKTRIPEGRSEVVVPDRDVADAVSGGMLRTGAGTYFFFEG